MNRFFLFIFIITYFCLVMLSCKSLSSRSKTYSVNAAEGYVYFTLEIDQKKLERLRDNLSTGSPDTCFLYYHMRVFKDLTLQFDSLSYDCLSDKKLDDQELDRFSRTLKPIIVDTSNALVAFEPFECVLQFSLKVGQNEVGKNNSIFVGHSKSLDFRFSPDE